MNSSRLHSRSRAGAASLETSALLFTSDADSTAGVLPGSYNDDHLVRGIVTDTIKNCGKTRHEIAESMSHLLGVRVTKRALDSYTSEASDQNRWPAQYTRAFCHSTGDWRLIRCVTEQAGFAVISKSEAKLYELGRQLLIQKRATEAIARLESELDGVQL